MSTDLDVVIGMAVYEAMATGKLRDLAGKLAASVSGDRDDMAESVALTDGHVTLQHHKHAGTGFTGRKEPGPLRIVTHGPESTDALDLGFRQHRKHLMTAGQHSSLRFGHCLLITTATD